MKMVKYIVSFCFSHRQAPVQLFHFQPMVFVNINRNFNYLIVANENDYHYYLLKGVVGRIHGPKPSLATLLKG